MRYNIIALPHGWQVLCFHHALHAQLVFGRGELQLVLPYAIVLELSMHDLSLLDLSMVWTR